MDLMCKTCQAPMDGVKCSTPSPHEPEDCNFACPACGETQNGDGVGCIQEIHLQLDVKSNVALNNFHSQPEIPPSIAQSIGAIILGYALAENNLRTMLSDLPDYRERSNLSSDIARLEKYQTQIVEAAREADSELAGALEACVEQLKRAFDKAHKERNVLAHGQMAHVSSETIVINESQQRTPNEKHEGWLEIAHPTWGTVKLTEDSLGEAVNNTKDLQSMVGDLNGLVQRMNTSINR